MACRRVPVFFYGIEDMLIYPLHLNLFALSPANKVCSVQRVYEISLKNLFFQYHRRAWTAEEMTLLSVLRGIGPDEVVPE